MRQGDNSKQNTTRIAGQYYIQSWQS